ncbi:MAG: hypothetical protein RL235_1005 [Chlamydiota bacterium]|jgi:cysteine desulfuration protein SufE
MNRELPFEEKIFALKKEFALCSGMEAKYLYLMDLGKRVPGMASAELMPEMIVPGCQSVLYLKSSAKGGRLYFSAHSEGLVSRGLAALLIIPYSGETATTILTVSPAYITELGLLQSLTPSRSNGLSQIHLKMKQFASQINCL